MSLKIGADPELFLRNRWTDAFVSAHDLLPGTKEDPFKVPHGAVQVDGTAAEFNIDPAETVEEFVHNIHAVMAELERMIPKSLKLAAVPVADYDPGYFITLPNFARELGCNPDYDAYTGLPNVRPDVNATFRTGSGHIHVGWTEGAELVGNHFEDCRVFASEMDIGVGYSSLVWDNDTKRRELYGRAGAFRPKSYGCEYRVLSNAWLKSRRTMEFVFNQTHAVFNKLEQSGPSIRLDLPTGFIQGMLNNSQIQDAKNMAEACEYAVYSEVA